MMVLPSSLNATAPAATSATISVITSPHRPLVAAAIGETAQPRRAPATARIDDLGVGRIDRALHGGDPVSLDQYVSRRIAVRRRVGGPPPPGHDSATRHS